MTRVVLAGSVADNRIGRVLDTLGVICERRTMTEILGHRRGAQAEPRALIMPEEQLVAAHALTDGDPARLRDRLSDYQYILVYPFQATADGLRALGAYADARAEAARIPNGGQARYVVDKTFGAAGAFAGLTVTPADTRTDWRLSIQKCRYPVTNIVSVDDGGLLVRIASMSGELFVAGSSAVFDPAEEVMRNLDTGARFSQLVPLLLFLRHAGAALWTTPQPFANLIIDDLNLRPRYGFVKAQTLAQHVDELGCAVSVAFIPWNCRRTSRGVVERYRSGWPRLSLSVHGCDHIGAEFATASADLAFPKIALSLARMEILKASTRLPYDRVMVFPQGKFSASAMAALRQSDFQAAVNTELIDELEQRGVPAGELLKPAVTAYGGFPLFLRRRVHEPMSNFALDLLLGKPCLIVTHHDDFRGGMSPLIAITRGLAALEPALQWTNLATIASGTYSVRPGSGGGTDIRVLASSTTVAPREMATAACFWKHEPLVDRELEILVDGESVKPERDGENVTFYASLAAGRPTSIEARMPSPAQPTLPAPSFRYRAKVGARRYLSEIRDNHVTRSATAMAAVKFVRGLR